MVRTVLEVSVGVMETKRREPKLPRGGGKGVKEDFL